MKCHACDKTLSEAEIIPLPKGHGYEVCSVCLAIALDAAYSDGFLKEDLLDDPEFEDMFGDGCVETLDSDALVSDDFVFDPTGWCNPYDFEDFS